MTINDKDRTIFMVVDSKTIEAFNIPAHAVKWRHYGAFKARGIEVPVTEDQYFAYMQPVWRDAKRKSRQKVKLVSTEERMEQVGFEPIDNVDIEEEIINGFMIEKLRECLANLDEVDRKIAIMVGKGMSEAAIGKKIGMSQKGVNKRKHKIFLKLRGELVEWK